MPIIVQTQEASVTVLRFKAIFFNDAEDPADLMAFQVLGDAYQVAETLGGGVDHDYASGRSRGWTDSSDQTQPQFPFQLLTLEQIDWIRGHRGRVVMWRDHLGQKGYGMYHAMPVVYSTTDPERLAANHTCTLTLESHSFDEAV